MLSTSVSIQITVSESDILGSIQITVSECDILGSIQITVSESDILGSIQITVSESDILGSIDYFSVIDNFLSFKTQILKITFSNTE